MPKKIIRFSGNRVTVTSYAKLVAVVKKEFNELELLIKRSTAETYWRIGRYISQHLLANRDRAKYGEHLLESLALDIGKDKSILTRMVQFYKAYPISATWHQLSWSHYRELITVEDKRIRQKLGQQAVLKNWNVEETRGHINAWRQKGNKGIKNAAVIQIEQDEQIKQIKFVRGKLYTYRLVETGFKPAKKGIPLSVDCGFTIAYRFTKAKQIGFSSGQIIRAVKKGSGYSTVNAISEEDIFTYMASVDRVIDGDTLIATIDLGFEFEVTQRLRLRGINCREMSTSKGIRAKQFVQRKLRGCKFIIVKTYKNRTDMYDRYLADIFYLPNEQDSKVVAAKGKFLNQELLDNRMAEVFRR